MSTIRVEIETDNAAFIDNGCRSELRDILHDVLWFLDDLAEAREAECLMLRDSNGNTVGKVTVT